MKRTGISYDSAGWLLPASLHLAPEETHYQAEPPTFVDEAKFAPSQTKFPKQIGAKASCFLQSEKNI